MSLGRKRSIVAVTSNLTSTYTMLKSLFYTHWFYSDVNYSYQRCIAIRCYKYWIVLICIQQRNKLFLPLLFCYIGFLNGKIFQKNKNKRRVLLLKIHGVKEPTKSNQLWKMNLWKLNIDMDPHKEPPGVSFTLFLFLYVTWAVVQLLGVGFFPYKNKYVCMRRYTHLVFFVGLTFKKWSKISGLFFCHKNILTIYRNTFPAKTTFNLLTLEQQLGSIGIRNKLVRLSLEPEPEPPEPDEAELNLAGWGNQKVHHFDVGLLKKEGKT